MAESNMYQREDAWYLRARIGGQEYRESLHTADVRQGRWLRDARIKALKAESFHGDERIAWKAAVVQWIQHAQRQIAPATLTRYASSLNIQVSRRPPDGRQDRPEGRSSARTSRAIGGRRDKR